MEQSWKTLELISMKSIVPYSSTGNSMDSLINRMVLFD